MLWRDIHLVCIAIPGVTYNTERSRDVLGRWIKSPQILEMAVATWDPALEAKAVARLSRYSGVRVN